MAAQSHRRMAFLVAASAAFLVSMGGVTATVGATDRIAISSFDDTSLSLTNRISAVDNVVVAIDGRLQRIIAAYPPGPPVVPVEDALTVTLQSLAAIIGTVDSRLCTQDGVLGQGDASLADADAFAADASYTGLVNQLTSVGTVLFEANGRLIRIYGAFPPGPPVDEVRNALIQVRTHAASGFEAVAGRLGDTIHPPSPCFTT